MVLATSHNQKVLSTLSNCHALSSLGHLAVYGPLSIQPLGFCRLLGDMNLAEAGSSDGKTVLCGCEAPTPKCKLHLTRKQEA